MRRRDDGPPKRSLMKGKSWRYESSEFETRPAGFNCVELKDQHSGKLTEGIVKEFLRNHLLTPMVLKSAWKVVKLVGFKKCKEGE